MNSNSKKAGKRKTHPHVTILAAPADPLRRIESAAAGDIGIARVAFGFLECLAGQYQASPFPDFRGCLLELPRLPPEIQKDARSLVDWALAPAQHDIVEIYRSSRNIQAVVVRMRRKSALGRRMRRRTAHLKRSHPPIEQGKWGPFGTVFDLLPDECGRPLTERVIALAQAFGPVLLQIVPHDHSMNGAWTVGVLTIRLNEDEYTVGKVTLALDVPKQTADPEVRRTEGDLIDFFETGTEGVIWMIEDDRRHGREALETICQGDQLTIEDQLGRTIWKGVIRCDKKTGWQKYTLNPGYGQQCALDNYTAIVRNDPTNISVLRFRTEPGDLAVRTRSR